MGVSQQLENRRTELIDIDTELGQLRARAERFKMENPFLADHQERIQQQWKSWKANTKRRSLAIASNGSTSKINSSAYAIKHSVVLRLYLYN